jgi:predicted RNA-binding Zn ribbon-like protein
MEFDWNKSRFSGGVLVYDLINTVVHRANPALRADRLAKPAEAARFAEAAFGFREGEVRPCSGRRVVTAAEHQMLLRLREAAFSLFQNRVSGQIPLRSDISRLLRVIAEVLEKSDDMPFAADSALSALRQTSNEGSSRVKACPNCDWLFLDRSKNGSRIWCDMAVCGNRHKARQSYLRRSKTFVGFEQ